MTAPTTSDDEIGVLATAVTALLIRYGGQAMFSVEEWKQAIEHDSTMLVTKEDPGPILVALVTRKEHHA